MLEPSRKGRSSIDKCLSQYGVQITLQKHLKPFCGFESSLSKQRFCGQDDTGSISDKDIRNIFGTTFRYKSYASTNAICVVIHLRKIGSLLIIIFFVKNIMT
jgi:hypothetical protein